MLRAKKVEYSDARFWKKSEKLPFLVILGQKGQFWPVFGQNGENYQKKRLEHFSSAYKPKLCVKFQKKVMNGF